MTDSHPRLPPGQHLLDDPHEFPVLDLGVQPGISDTDYTLEISGLVGHPVTLSLAELQALPHTDITADFHCVTRWSKYDIQWSGVSWHEIANLVQPAAAGKFIIEYGRDGYSTNVPASELEANNVIIAYSLSGEPIPVEHGGPVRMIIPHLYGWKGSKFLKRIEVVAEDRPGFWEVRGYHNHGNPWEEERYS